MDQKNQDKFVDGDKFGERLRQLRKKEGLTQSAFGESLGGVSLATITRMERGVFKPQGDFLIKLAETYDCDLRWLLTGVAQKEMDASADINVVRDPLTYEQLKARRDELREVIALVAGGEGHSDQRLDKLQTKLAYLEALLRVGQGPG